MRKERFESFAFIRVTRQFRLAVAAGVFRAIRVERLSVDAGHATALMAR